MEIKHTLKQPMRQKRNHWGNQKITETSENESTTYEHLLLVDVIKAVLRENSWL